MPWSKREPSRDTTTRQSTCPPNDGSTCARRACRAAAELAAALAAATEGMPFRAGVFAPFLADVERARTQPPLALAALGDSEQATLVEGLLHARGGGTEAIIAFSGVSDARRLGQWAAGAGRETILIDLK